MGFWDLFAKKKLSSKGQSGIMAELTVHGHKYMLAECYIDFQQDINKKNQPDGIPYNKKFIVTLKERPDIILTSWSINPCTRHDGEINFYSCSEEIASGSLFTVSFKRAMSQSLYRTASVKADRTKTRIQIIPENIWIGNEEI